MPRYNVATCFDRIFHGFPSVLRGSGAKDTWLGRFGFPRHLKVQKDIENLNTEAFAPEILPALGSNLGLIKCFDRT